LLDEEVAMKANRMQVLATALAGGALLLGAWARADEVDTTPRFAAPVRISAGDAIVGVGRYYPSPVLHDIDGDGLLDIVVADLFGKVTVAKRVPAENGVAYAKEAPLLARDGKPLKFSNW
jgi:hypothetical protein